MKYVFIYPSGSQYEKTLQRYNAYKRALYQFDRTEVVLLDGKSFQGKNSDTGMLCGDADIIMVHICACTQVIQLFQHWKARDKVVLVDMSIPVVLDSNQNRFHIGAAMPASENTNHISEIIIEKEKLIWMLKLADGVIANSIKMMEDWTGLVRIHYLPDFIDTEMYLLHPAENHSGMNLGVNINEGGSGKLYNTGLLHALEVIAARHNEIRIHIFGEHPQFAHIIKISPTQKRFISPSEFSQWQSLLVSIDIGLLPMMNAFDDRCGREDVLELMLMKIPWIASDMARFHELRQYGWMVQNTSGAWERILEDMVVNLDHYRQEAAESYLYCLGQGIDENIDQFITACTAFRADLYTGA